MRTLLRSGVALVAAAALGAGMVMGGSALTAKDDNNGLKGQPATASQIYLDEIKDYGVCRGVDPTCYNEWGNGWKEGEAKRILIWSRTAGPRHAHLGEPIVHTVAGTPPRAQISTGITPGNIAQTALKAWAEERGIAVDYTEDLTRFTNLNNYQAVVFLSSNRDTLDDGAQTNLMQYIRGGGGFVGIHNAFGAEYHWPYYEGLLGGANFYNHERNRAGTVETINNRDVSTSFMTPTWGFTDEWYNLIPYPSFVNVLLEVDEATSDDHISGHGASHPVSWCQYYDGGRAFLTTLGHDPKAWNSEPLEGDAFFKEHVMNGLESAMGIKPFCTV